MIEFLIFSLISSAICDLKTFPKQKFSINENDPVGSDVGIIDRTIFRRKVSKFLSLMRSPTDQYFYLETTTGKIRIKKSIDREIVCPFLSYECLMHFRIKILSSDSTESVIMLDVSVEIKDVNDNSPKFAEDEYKLTISESSKIGSRISLPIATDKDSNANGVISYKIIADPLNKVIKRDFRIIYDKQTKIITPFLEQMRLIDRESISKYKFTLRAEDSGGKFCDTMINLRVDDANDNYPQWIGLPYKVTIRECDRLNQALLVLLANDIDQGNYGAVSYKISPLADSLIKSHFHLYGSKLFISTTLDYENEKHRTILVPVMAMDEGDLTNSTNVEVNVEDCNDNNPIINVVYTKSQNQYQDSVSEKLAIDENNEKELEIVNIDVTDADSLENGRVSCRLENYQTFFRLDHTNTDSEGGIMFQLIKIKGQSFDRETISTVKLDINCADNGQPQRSSRQSIVIVVNDVNDNAPRLVSKLWYTITENNDNGAIVGKLVAEDFDSHENKIVDFYLIHQSQDGVFHLTKDGNIYANTRLDREYRSRYILSIKIKDRGNPSLESTCNISIIVTDDNDGVPLYVGERTFSIDESTGESITQKVIAHLNATDSDEGNNGSIEFILDKSKIVPYSLRDAYSVSKNGLLTVRGNLDREKIPIHQLQLIIQDRGIKPQSTSVQITIQLLDINDNKPEFIFPNDKENAVNITVDLTPDSIITVLKADDKDAGENGTINFEARPISNYFSIDKNGNVILKKALQQSGKYFIPKHNINVCAFDLGTKSLRQYSKLSIYVSDHSPDINGRKTDNSKDNSKKDFKNEDIDSSGFENQKRRPQINVLILMVMAVLVMIVFFAVVAVLSFMYLRKERFNFFGNSGSSRNMEKADTNYSQKMNEQSNISRMSSYPNLTSNPIHRYNSKDSMHHYTVESNIPNKPSMYNTLIIPQNNQFDQINSSNDGPDLHQKIALLNYSNLYERPEITEGEGYFSLNHNIPSSNVERNYIMQMNQFQPQHYESKVEDLNPEFPTPQQHKRTMKVDSSFV